MVKYTLQLDSVFGSLADPTRRDIFARVIRGEQTVSEITSHYQMSMAAISKHLKILEKSKLIHKRRDGRKHYVRANPEALKTVQDYLDQYQQLWNERFDRLEILVTK